MPGPLVSVVICAYNPGAELLRECVDSVLAQTHSELEVLIFDDGSSDDSFRALLDLEDPRIRIHREPNRGKPRCLNHALREARGAYLAIQDADDTSYPERIARQLGYLEAHPEVAGVFCGHDLILEGRRLAPRSKSLGPAACAELLDELRMPAHDPTVMYRMSAIEGEEFGPELQCGEGVDFAFRMGERAPLAVLGECLYSYRIHPTSITRSDWRRREALIQEVYRQARRRRGQPQPPHSSDPGERSPRNRDLDNNLAAHFMESALDLRRQGRLGEALRTALHCARLHPLDLYYHRALAYTLLPESLLERIRGRSRPDLPA